jgi:hypothetical protein
MGGAGPRKYSRPLTGTMRRTLAVTFATDGALDFLPEPNAGRFDGPKCS